MMTKTKTKRAVNGSCCVLCVVCCVLCAVASVGCLCLSLGGRQFLGRALLPLYPLGVKQVSALRADIFSRERDAACGGLPPAP